jgi:hypothetical protein
MGLLDGDIAELFGQVFGDLVYLDATLHRTVKTAAADGDVTSVPTDIACKAQFDEVTEKMRAASGYADTDVAIIILQSGISPAVNTDDEITIEGNRYLIRGPIDSDPARSYWFVRAQKD